LKLNSKPSSKSKQLNHPIVEQSFEIIDQEAGEHHLSSEEYAIARRVIHATADFEHLQLLQFSPDAISSGITALRRGVPIVTDVTMVQRGICSLVAKTFDNPLIAAVEQATVAETGRTLTETGLLKCWSKYPQAIYVIGNAPTALIALCAKISSAQKKCEQTKHEQTKTSAILPALVIGVPVGFVSVIESKQALAELNIPQILIRGRKGGSPAAASILNALLVLAS
jgi:precorrin-8X/cobalt-precorrin-8 methylmutase